MTLIKDSAWHKRHIKKLLRRKAIARSHLLYGHPLKPMEIKPPIEPLNWFQRLLLKLKAIFL